MMEKFARQTNLFVLKSCLMRISDYREGAEMAAFLNNQQSRESLTYALQQIAEQTQTARAALEALTQDEQS